MSEKLFEKASRNKYRFQSARGSLSSEDLWDLSLSSLNGLAKSLNKQIKESEEEDFLKEARAADTETKDRFDIVLHVLNTKKAEHEAREAAVEKAEKKRKLLEILARKQDASLEGMSEDELKAQIASL